MLKRNRKVNARLSAGKTLDNRLGKQKAKRSLKPGAISGAMQKAFMPLIKFVLIFALTSFALLGGYVGLAHSSFFGLRQVEIEGSSHLSRLDILSAAGLSYYTNLLNLKPRQAEQGIRELPWITQVTVKRELPGNVKITVQEEIPYAVGLIEGELFYLNRSLKPFAPFAYDEQISLPIVSGLSKAELLKEDDELEARLADGLEILTQLHDVNEPLWGKLSQMDLSSPNGIKLVFEDMPATIKLGGTLDADKLEQLRRVTNDLAARNELKRTVLIDLSIDQRIIVRLGRYGV